MIAYDRVRCILAVGGMALLLISCGGGGAEVAMYSTTTGQELMDLKKALDSGVITQAEYDQQRRIIINRNQ